MPNLNLKLAVENASGKYRLQLVPVNSETPITIGGYTFNRLLTDAHRQGEDTVAFTGVPANITIPVGTRGKVFDPDEPTKIIYTPALTDPIQVCATTVICPLSGITGSWQGLVETGLVFNWGFTAASAGDVRVELIRADTNTVVYNELVTVATAGAKSGSSVWTTADTDSPITLRIRSVVVDNCQLTQELADAPVLWTNYNGSVCSKLGSYVRIQQQPYTGVFRLVATNPGGTIIAQPDGFPRSFSTLALANQYLQDNGYSCSGTSTSTGTGTGSGTGTPTPTATPTTVGSSALNVIFSTVSAGMVIDYTMKAKVVTTGLDISNLFTTNSPTPTDRFLKGTTVDSAALIAGPYKSQRLINSNTKYYSFAASIKRLKELYPAATTIDIDLSVRRKPDPSTGLYDTDDRYRVMQVNFSTNLSNGIVPVTLNDSTGIDYDYGGPVSSSYQKKYLGDSVQGILIPVNTDLTIGRWTIDLVNLTASFVETLDVSPNTYSPIGQPFQLGTATSTGTGTTTGTGTGTGTGSGSGTGTGSGTTDIEETTGYFEG